jgi:hypothetical protein
VEFLKTKPSLVAYAPFDLKNATVRAKDGFGNPTGSSPVVGAAGASGGATTVPITAGTMPTTVPVGASVNFAGDTTDYTITARVTTGTGVDEVQSAASIASTSGTFTFGITLPGNSSVPTGAVTFNATSAAIQTLVDTACAGLVVAGVVYTAGDITVAGGPINSAAVTFTFDGLSVDEIDITTMITATDIDLNDSTPPVITETTKGYPIGTTTSIDITPVLAGALTGGEAITFGPQILEVKLGEGNFTYDENREIEYLRNRGILDTYREGDEQPLDVSFDFTWEFLKSLSGAAVPTFEEVLKQQGAAADWVSSNTADPCAAYVVDIEIINAPACGNVLAEVISLPQFFYTQLSHDSDAAQVSVTGQCNVTKAVITRTNDY